ncbi:MAG: hypothetical protein IKF22_08615 [Lachnospiraceae bacterium]|nr:hypothetical protein [Lachnospiraceae bacterium]
MTTETKLQMLKIDLGITTTAYDERLTQYLQAAKNEIEREGVILSFDSQDDDNLQIMYAAWMWRKRDTGEGMPRMIRWQINNRLFDMGGGSDG